MNVQEQIKVLKAQISSSQELLTKLEDQIKKEQEFPKDGDKYWYIGKIGTGCWGVWEDSSVDKHLKSIGNVFETEGEAEFAVEKLKVEAELRKFSRPFLWGTENTAILFDGDDFKFDTRMAYVFQGVIYFESEKKAKQAIDAVGKDRVKKYIFGMEE